VESDAPIVHALPLMQRMRTPRTSNLLTLTIMLAGATMLQCSAEIEKPVMRHNDAHWLSMDAVILLTNETNENVNLHCHLCYFREDNTKVVLAGSYVILAMVRTNLRLHSTAHLRALLTQVMGITDRNDDPRFALRGDVVSVCSQ
jgi:hypothetical protein